MNETPEISPSAEQRAAYLESIKRERLSHQSANVLLKLKGMAELSADEYRTFEQADKAPHEPLPHMNADDRRMGEKREPAID